MSDCDMHFDAVVVEVNSGHSVQWNAYFCGYWLDTLNFNHELVGFDQDFVYYELKFTLFFKIHQFVFQAYKGQITALLGHNGAGKSTTMNVLTGMLAPSDGSAQINGFNIGTEMDMVSFSY